MAGRTAIREINLALLACCVLLQWPGYAWATMQPQEMLFERLSIEDGLSQSNVMDVIQDSSGFLWFATENGLNRYDGYSFLEIHRGNDNDGHALASDFISDLSVDRKGNLWIATDGGGLAWRNAQTAEITVLRHDRDNENSIAADILQAVLADPRGWVWIGTRHKGLDRLNPHTGEVTHYVHDEGDSTSLSSDMIMSIALDQRGMLWIATEDGLNRLDPRSGEITRFYHDADDTNSLSQNSLHSLYVDRAGTVWVGTQSGGLNRFEPRRGRVTRYLHDAESADSLSNNRVQAIVEDDAERLWVGTARGLNLMNRENGTFTRYNNSAADPSSLGSDNVVSLFQDESSVLWVGTKTAGLSKWNPRSWAFGHVTARPGRADSLSSPYVSSFTESVDGSLWVGTFGGGLNVFDRDMRVTGTYRNDPKDARTLSDDRIMALLADAQDRIWVGTMGGGLNRVDPRDGSVVRYGHEAGAANGLSASGIMSLFEDSQHRIWAGTFGGGINRYDQARDAFVTVAPATIGQQELSGARITAMAETDDGLLWFGTDGSGLYAMNERNGEWLNWRHDSVNQSSISGNTIYALHVDRNGELWVGTRAGLDLVLKDPATGEPVGFRNVTRAYEFANDTIYGIRSDTAGNLWVSTNYGLTSFEPDSGRTSSYHRSHGLQGEEFNFGAHFAGSGGRLYFGGTNGFNAFDPASLIHESKPPAVVLTAFQKLNKTAVTKKPFEQLDVIELDYIDDVVTFEFAALDFVAPQQNRYAYMLEGFDRDWIQSGNKRRITYTNLDGGKYTLRVKAANSDGVWSDQGLAIPFHVAPPPWKTWWAYLGYGLLTVSAFFALLSWQRRELAREADYRRRLESEVRDRTRELADRNADLRVANCRLQDVSYTDALTGLRNRRYLFDEISKDIALLRGSRDISSSGRRRASCEEMVFIVVDVDHFKPINDNIGHQAGDEMLLQIRDCLVGACRSSDIVIRWGGDEFLIVARQTNREEAAALAERIRSRVADKVFELGNGHRARSSTSIGFAPFPFLVDKPHALSWEQVLGIADAAMYRAKAFRDAWSGIYGLGWNDGADELVAAVKTDAAALAEAGAIHIIDSLSMAAERSA